MRTLKKHLIGSCIWLLVFLSCIYFFSGNLLVSDASLIDDFHLHRDSFGKIGEMASRDSIHTVYRELVLLEGFERWADNTQKGFSTERWDQYRELFDDLGSTHILHVSRKGAAIEICCGSIATLDQNEDYETPVLSKGYIFSLEKPAPLVDSLDGKGFENCGAYRPIEGNWYLYKDCGISKPE